MKGEVDMTNRTKPTCPDCKSIMIPYLYGMPAGPPPEDGGADDFFIAGCLPDFPSPKWGVGHAGERAYTEMMTQTPKTEPVVQSSIGKRGILCINSKG